MENKKIEEEVGAAIGVMAQLGKWGKMDSSMTDFGVYGNDAILLQEVGELLSTKFTVKFIALNSNYCTLGEELLEELDRTLQTLYFIVTDQTKHYIDQWVLLGKSFSNMEFEKMFKTLDLVRYKLFSLKQRFEGKDFYSMIIKMDEYFPVVQS